MRALDLLGSEEYLIRRCSLDTFGRDWKSVQIPHANTLNGAIEDYGNKVETDVIGFDVMEPGTRSTEKLFITDDHFVYSIVRLRYVKQTPSILEYTCCYCKP